MKTKIAIATIVVALLGVGTYIYVNSSKLIEPPIPRFDKSLVGTWKIDTAYNKADSNKLSVIIPYIFKDSTSFTFNDDSTLNIASSKEKSTEHYYLNKDTLFTKEDSTYETSQVCFINDSIVSLASKDSTVVVLRRVK